MRDLFGMSSTSYPLLQPSSSFSIFFFYCISLSEVSGQGHWFAGVVNDDVLQKFLDKQLDPALNPGLPHPPLPEAFTISTMNPGSSGSK